MQRSGLYKDLACVPPVLSHYNITSGYAFAHATVNPKTLEALNKSIVEREDPFKQQIAEASFHSSRLSSTQFRHTTNSLMCSEQIDGTDCRP
jgi:hypothetical protein